ncbi:MAG TPA: gamma-glutamylcyclotransferase [Methanosarcina sp.]|nr:gamma-glutamylcyclotransferase [Methanosarcina sp.]
MTGSNKNNEFIKQHIQWVADQLGIEKLPKIILLDEPEDTTFGQYDSGDHTIRLVTGGRHPVDVLRTLAHELEHHKQNLKGELTPGAGETGTPQENEANSAAGIVLRNFSQKNPEYLGLEKSEDMSTLKEAGGLPVYYFAYGMLTDPKNMPGAVEVGTAELKNFKFELLKFANIVEDAGSKVTGALWEIHPDSLSALDKVEGVPYLYNRKQVPVFCDGQRYEAYVYTMTPDARDALGGTKPTKKYMASLYRGYKNFNLPTDQLEQISEAAMNPTSFAQAVTTGTEKGVRVGFEFEVLVPAKVIKAAKASGNESISEIVDTLIDNIYKFTASDLDKIIKFKQPLTINRKSINSFSEMVNSITGAKIGQIKKLYDQLSDKTKQEILGYWKYRQEGYDEPNIPMAFCKTISNQYRGTIYHWIPPKFRLNRLSPDDKRLLESISFAARSMESEDTIIQNTLEKLKLTNSTKFSEAFVFDAKTMLKAMEKRSVYINSQYSDAYSGGDYSGAVKVLKPAIEQAFGTTHVFSEYHQKAKNLTDWYIEPDGSLEPDSSSDGDAEVVSPPMPANIAIDSLKKFFAIAQANQLYSNSSTGLHINVSIPDTIDILKLAIFVGDQHVLQQFGRENNDYATSVLRDLQGKVDVGVKRTGQLDLKALQRVAKDITNDHTASISDNKKYISFRHAGGNYLQNPEGVLNVVGRFVHAMVIASDPNLYRNEYLKKLTAFVGRHAPAMSTQPKKGIPPGTVTAFARFKKEGLPIIKIHTTWRGSYRDAFTALGIARYDDNFGYTRGAKQEFTALVNAAPAIKNKPQYIREYVGSLIVYPINITGLIQAFNLISKGNLSGPGWFVVFEVVPLNSPAYGRLANSVKTEILSNLQDILGQKKRPVREHSDYVKDETYTEEDIKKIRLATRAVEDYAKSVGINFKFTKHFYDQITLKRGWGFIDYKMIMETSAAVIKRGLPLLAKQPDNTAFAFNDERTGLVFETLKIGENSYIVRTGIRTNKWKGTSPEVHV